MNFYTFFIILYILGIAASYSSHEKTRKELAEVKSYLNTICVTIDPAGIEDVCNDYLIKMEEVK